jgi:hypothetical protein
MLQYIRVRADLKSLDATLAEVEAYTFGENIALGTVRRGGNFVEETGRGISVTDGDFNTSWSQQTSRAEKIRWEWDLGALFWVDRLIVVGAPPGYRQVRRILDHQLFVSDGQRTLTGEVAYNLLFDFDTGPGSGAGSQEIHYVLADPRLIRYLSSVFSRLPGDIVEINVFATGHPARLEMTSGFIDLGAIAGDRRSKLIQSLAWEADQPQGTHVYARTRSGDELLERTLYFHRDGREISKTEYDNLNRFLRGKTITVTETGQDWSSWSSLYQVSGQGFLSPSPKQFLQIMLILSSDRPEAAPTLHSLAVEFVDALLSRVVGKIHPKSALPGVLETFSYQIAPEFRSGDGGFNRLRFEIPSSADPDSLFVRVGNRMVQPTSVQVSADSLIIELPQLVRRDSVEVTFRLRIAQNPTLFKAFVGHTQQAGLWQPVDPAERFATSVFFPAVPQTDQLIRGLSIQPPVITPNGDGVGDQTAIRFSVLNVEKKPEVQIYGLDGRLIRELEGGRGSDGFYLYTWTGRDRSGTLVPPGLYLCQIQVAPQAGEGTLSRTISVIY